MNKRFLFFENFKSIADKLPDDMRLKFYDALLNYVFEGVEPEDDVISALITAIKPSLDKEDNRGGAREGAGRPKQNEVLNNQKNQSFLETETEDLNNIPPKNKFSDENIILSPYKGKTQCSVCQRKAKFDINGQKFCGQHTRIELTKLGRLDLMPAERFEIPTLDEVKSYCQERNNGVDAERFIDFYASKGWKVGNQPMKDWRAAVRTWERSSASAPVTMEKVTFGGYQTEREQKEYEAAYRQAELTKQRLAERVMKRGA